MLESIYNIPFLLLEVPNLKIKQPTWLQAPSAMTVFSMVLFSYFLVTGGKYNSLPLLLNIYFINTDPVLQQIIMCPCRYNI